MTTMNVSLPENLKTYVDTQVEHGNYGSTSEFVRELIRKDHAQRRLREALLDGARSPIVAHANDDYFESLRAQVAIES